MNTHRKLDFRTSILLPVTLIWLVGVGGGFGASQTLVFKPAGDPNRQWWEFPYTGCGSSTDQDLPINYLRTAQNETNGGVYAFVLSLELSAKAQSWQQIGFTTEVPSTVTVTAEFQYKEATFAYNGLLSKNETDCFIVGDSEMGGGDGPDPITACLSWQNIVQDIIGIAGMIVPELAGIESIAAVVQVVDFLLDAGDLIMTAYQCAQLADALYGSGASSKTVTRTFTCPAGYRIVDVGVQSVAATFSLPLIPGGFNFGGALVMGQVWMITVTINPNPDQLPDMAIGKISVPGYFDLHAGTPADITLVRQNLGNLHTAIDSYSLEVSADNGLTWRDIGYPEYDRENFPGHSSKTNHVFYTFPEKGTYLLRAIADAMHDVTEINELNNTNQITVYVSGWKPNPPAMPWAYTSQGTSTLELHRNREYCFQTSGTDHENDPLAFVFMTDGADGSAWRALHGWGPSTNCYVIPVLDDPDLLPPVTPGMPADEHWTFPAERFLMRVYSADQDGLSEPSPSSAIHVILNTVPTTPTISGDTNASTIRGFAITASTSDINNDQVAFRFDWGENTNAPVWTDWYWCPKGETNLAISHLYTNAGNYWVHAQATDRYASKYTNPLECSWVATHLARIYTYRPGSNAVVVTTKDAERGAALPNVGFYLSSATTNISATTDAGGYFAAGPLPGVYTVTFSNAPGYLTPSAQTNTLATNGHIAFCGAYHHKTGTIQVHCNTTGQGQLYGQGTAIGANFAFSGASWSTTAWQGDYEIVFTSPADLDHFDLPKVRRVTKTLGDTAIEFCGQYIQRPVASLSMSYPTNNYIPPNAFVLMGDEGVTFDASASQSPNQPAAGGGCPAPTNLTINSYWLHYGDGWWCWEATNWAGPGTWKSPDGKFDGKNVHTFHKAGTIPVTLIVADSCGVSNRLLVQTNVWVKQRPVAQMAISPASSISGETVTFTGAGTDADDGDLISAYEWSIDGGPPVTLRTFSTNGLAPGDHSISLRVRANDNVWSQPATASLTITKPKEWPIFKQDICRLSGQGTYDERPHGQLPYGPAGDNWPRAADSPVEGSPVAANVDNNWTNGLEVAFVSRAGNLFVTSSKGNVLWTPPRPIGRSSSTPAIGDINGDTWPEIVVGSTNGVYAFDHNGNTNYLYPSNSFIFSMPVIADIDPRAPGLEVAITADDGSVHLIYTNGTAGTNHWPFTYTGVPFPSPPDDPTNVYFTSGPAVADIDPDLSGLEVVVGGADGRLYVLDCTGSNIHSYYIGTNAPIRTTPAIAEVCPQVPGPEIVFGADNGVFYCLNYAWASKSLTKVWEYADNAPIRSSPAVSILGGYDITTRAQIAFGCDNGDVHVLLGTNGAPVGSFSCAGTNVMVRSSPAIADIDTIHNGVAEVIFGASDGTVYAVSFMGHNPTVVWSNKLSSPIFSSTAVADIDHNPDLEVLIGARGGTDNKRLFVFRAIPDLFHLPVAAFTASPLSGGQPLAVTFTDQSSNSPTAWQWDFGDGNTSQAQNPTNTYSSPGTNTVTLTVANTNGSGSTTRTNYIIVNPVPVANFTGTPLLGDVSLDVQFTDQSLFSPASWAWNFGDGQGSSQRNPSHTYLTTGNVRGDAHRRERLRNQCRDQDQFRHRVCGSSAGLLPRRPCFRLGTADRAVLRPVNPLADFVELELRRRLHQLRPASPAHVPKSPGDTWSA